jgi:hypothetical protein
MELPSGSDAERLSLEPERCRRLTTLVVPGEPTSGVQTEWANEIRRVALERRHEVPAAARFYLRVDFRIPAHQIREQASDLDNLVHTLITCMEDKEFFGAHKPHSPFKGDELVDYVQARKRKVRKGEWSGACVEVWLVEVEAA